MEEFKKFIHVAGAFIAALLTIAASAGAINAGGIYIAAGIANLGWLYPLFKWASAYIKEGRSYGSASAGASKTEKPADKYSKEDISNINKSYKI